MRDIVEPAPLRCVDDSIDVLRGDAASARPITDCGPLNAANFVG